MNKFLTTVFAVFLAICSSQVVAKTTTVNTTKENEGKSTSSQTITIADTLASLTLTVDYSSAKQNTLENILNAITLSYDGTTITPSDYYSSASKSYTIIYNDLSSGIYNLLVSKSTASSFDLSYSVISTQTVTAAVPEPTTYALMGIGLLGLITVARRKKNQSENLKTI